MIDSYPPTLPTGAATAAKQPALGTAGSPSTDVITVQAIIGGVAFPTYFNGIQVHDSAHDGNLLGVGGRASTATPTAVSADGDAVHAWFDRNGRLNTLGLPLKYPVALITRTGVTTNYVSSTLDIPYGRGMQLVINVSSAPGGQTLTPQIYSITNAFGVAILTATNVVNGTGSFMVEICPGATPVAATAGPGLCMAVSHALADQTLIAVSHSGAGSWTYTIQYCLIP